MGSSENPVPLWGTIMIGIAGGLILLCCLIIICKYTCCRRKETQKSSYGGGVGFRDLDPHDMNDSKVQPDLEDLALFNKESYGRLQFALEYDKHVEDLEVTVIQAQNLRGTGPFLGSIINPYIRVYISPNFNPIYDTNVHHLTSSPVFNQKYVFKLPYSSRHAKALVMNIYHDVLLSKPDKLGQVRVPLGSYDLAQRIEEWHDIEKPGPDEKDTNLGDVCLSLRYVPTPGRLTVVVIEAKGLKEVQKEAKEYCVKLSLVQKRKTLRKRRTTNKTSINPYYNESFIFDASVEAMQQAYLRVTVAIPRMLGRGKALPVGCLEMGLGSRAPEAAVRHWQEVLTNVGRPIVHWHTLAPASDR